jgi:hypothetical protein
MSTTPTDQQTVRDQRDTAGSRDTGTRTALRVLVVTLTLLLVAWGALTLVSLLARDTVHRTASFNGVRTVDLDLGFESVTFTGSDDTSAVRMERSWTWSMRKPSTSTRQVGDRLVMTSHCGWDIGLGCSGDVRLVVPRGTVLRVRGGDGHLSLRGTTGTVNVSTGDGAIDASDLSGAVVLRTGDGSIDASDLRSSSVAVHTGDGSVRLAFASAPQDVRADTGDGSVDVAVPRDGDPWKVDATTGDGGRTIDVATDPAAARAITVHTGDGSVGVHYGG